MLPVLLDWTVPLPGYPPPPTNALEAHLVCMGEEDVNQSQFWFLSFSSYKLGSVFWVGINKWRLLLRVTAKRRGSTTLTWSDVTTQPLLRIPNPSTVNMGGCTSVPSLVPAQIGAQPSCHHHHPSSKASHPGNHPEDIKFLFSEGKSFGTGCRSLSCLQNKTEKTKVLQTCTRSGGKSPDLPVPSGGATCNPNGWPWCGEPTEEVGRNTHPSQFIFQTCKLWQGRVECSPFHLPSSSSTSLPCED